MLDKFDKECVNVTFKVFFHSIMLEMFLDETGIWWTRNMFEKIPMIQQSDML